LAASLLVLTLLGGGTGIWWWSHRAAQARETEAALVVMWYYLNAGRSVDARTSLERAEHAMAGGGSRNLTQHLLQTRKDVDVILELEEIRLRHSTTSVSHIDLSRLQSAYAAAFRKYGIDVLALDADTAATRLATSAVRSSLLLALDHWIGVCEADRAALLSRIVNAADDDGWRREFRAAVCAGDGARMAALVSRPNAQKQPPPVLHWVANALSRRGRRDDAFQVLSAAHRWFPYNFWVNHAMGELTFNRGPDRAAEAVGYYRAALALRPDSPGVNVNLANALTKQKDLNGAVAYYAVATKLDPDFAEAHYLYGRALSEQDRPAEAEAEYRHALNRLPERSPLRGEVERLMLDSKQSEPRR
jgi:tetratricopeptide (TPR) repeat protein